MNASLPNQNQFKDLNEKQVEAVTLQNESALILAGAGSGKTKVLTSRIAWLIQTNVWSQPIQRPPSNDQVFLTNERQDVCKT